MIQSARAKLEVDIPYVPNSKQQVFHGCPADEAVYGGAKGGGKSCALVMEAMAYGLEYAGAEIYLFRETFDDLEANIINEWKKRVPAELYSYNEAKHVALMKNGTRVFFRYVNNKKDADRYQGRSMDFIGVDELTKHEEEAIQTLLSCLRSPKGFPPRFRGTCNPGGVGHIWVKKRYILPTLKGQRLYRDKVSGNVVAFIPATVYDNIVLMQNDPAYARRLENLPPAKRKAFLLGDWDAYEGQAFEEFNYDIHVCPPFPIPDHWPRWRSCDNGYTDPFAWYWLTVDEDGIVYIYREYTREYGMPKKTYSDQARRVVELSTYTKVQEGLEVQVQESIPVTVVGHDAFNSHPLAEQGKTIVDYYFAGGVTNCVRAITDRRLRKATWHEYLKPFAGPDGRMTARVQIFSTCKKLIETLPQQVEDEEDPEKVAETNYDHWYDGAGYGLVYYHIAKSKPPKPEYTGEARKIHDHIERVIKDKRRQSKRYLG